MHVNWKPAPCGDKWTTHYNAAGANYFCNGRDHTCSSEAGHTRWHVCKCGAGIHADGILAPRLATFVDGVTAAALKQLGQKVPA